MTENGTLLLPLRSILPGLSEHGCRELELGRTNSAELRSRLITMPLKKVLTIKFFGSYLSYILQCTSDKFYFVEVVLEDVFKKVGSDHALSQIIEQEIEHAIRQKKFLPHQKLPSENELSSMFGVSRTALREALRMLSARGLIQIRKGSGIFVNDFCLYTPANR